MKSQALLPTRGALGGMFAIIFLGLVGLALLGVFLLEAPFRLAVGWTVFLATVAPNIQWNLDGVMTGIFSVIVFTIGLHCFAAWLARYRSRYWTFKRSITLSFLVITCFATGIAALGVSHQFGWLAKSPTPMFESDRRSLNRIRTLSNIRQLGIAVQNADTQFQQLPTGVVTKQGELLHGWMTQVLPFLNGTYLAYDKIHFDRPWDDPTNIAMQVEVRELMSLRVGDHIPTRDPRGYSVTHFAGNVQVLKPGAKVKYSDVTDGHGHTILIGELGTGFRPWAHPLNVRDPANGLGQRTDCLGSPTGDGKVIVTFVDCSTRTLSTKINPQVLKALATPNGGETVKDSDID